MNLSSDANSVTLSAAAPVLVPGLNVPYMAFSPGAICTPFSDLGSEASSADLVYLFPVTVTRATPITDMGLYLGGSSTGSIRLGIYDSHPDTGEPRNRLAQTEFTFSAQNWEWQNPITPAIDLEPGVYWIAYHMSTGTMTYKSIPINRLHNIGMYDEGYQCTGIAKVLTYASGLPNPWVPAFGDYIESTAPFCWFINTP
ncbi:MAG: hypothetical protein ACK5LG_21920 [Bacteroides thetaiotaomicron]